MNTDREQKSVELHQLPIERHAKDLLYNPQNPIVQKWLQEHWTFGYNPLAVDNEFESTKVLLKLPDGSSYHYSDPSHSFTYYRQNRDENNPNFLVHLTQTGWLEIALALQGGNIGKENETWTASFDPQRWWPGSFPSDFTFTKPPERFIELMFDAEQLRSMGIAAEKAPSTNYFLFRQRLPLKALVATSKAYIEQVLNFNIE